MNYLVVNYVAPGSWSDIGFGWHIVALSSGSMRTSAVNSWGIGIRAEIQYITALSIPSHRKISSMVESLSSFTPKIRHRPDLSLATAARTVVYFRYWAGTVFSPLAPAQPLPVPSPKQPNQTLLHPGTYPPLQ